MSYSKIISEIFILIIYVIIGFYAKKRKFLTDSGIEDISKIVVNIAMPMLVVSAMNIDYETEYVHNMITLAICAFFYLSTVSLLSRKLATSITHREDHVKSIRYALIFGNTSFLGYPISYALFGELGMLYTSVFVAMQNIFQWTVGVHIFKQDKFEFKSLKRLLNPGLIAIFFGMTLFFLGIKTPPYLQRVIKNLGAISVPLALMVIGATLAEYELKKIIRDREAQVVSAIKSLAFPTLFLGVLLLLPIPSMLKAILIIQTAAPVQASAALFAKNFGGESGIVAKCVAITTLLCTITIPLFLMFVQ
ncbi:AEC family transporter [Fusibacter ferrireducens]|uniref:AEC family transporter n=1 Tax=Fusibacter ferrireducens TaxID=2785058 RepID=A0ABR9ZT63_9FIRM|nr:AEC family transporter [Fusibacter ferrireducens]MBF4693546.1 AEC family transporter [Fusibacter ferrireducens]